MLSNNTPPSAHIIDIPNADAQIEEEVKQPAETKQVEVPGFESVDFGDNFVVSVPKKYFSSINLDLYRLPVLATDGAHYDASDFINWYRLKHTSPIVPSLTLKNLMIIDWDFYQEIQEFFANVYKKNKDLLHDGNHENALKKLSLYSEQLTHESPFVINLLESIHKHNLSLEGVTRFPKENLETLNNRYRLVKLSLNVNAEGVVDVDIAANPDYIAPRVEQEEDRVEMQFAGRRLRITFRTSGAIFSASWLAFSFPGLLGDTAARLPYNLHGDHVNPSSALATASIIAELVALLSLTAPVPNRAVLFSAVSILLQCSTVANHYLAVQLAKTKPDSVTLETFSPVIVTTAIAFAPSFTFAAVVGAKKLAVKVGQGLSHCASVLSHSLWRRNQPEPAHLSEPLLNPSQRL